MFSLVLKGGLTRWFCYQRGPDLHSTPARGIPRAGLVWRRAEWESLKREYNGRVGNLEVGV